MFWADGDAGLARFAGLVDGYARAGFRTELQVRYHPPDGHAGDIAGWLEYVRAAVRTFAPRALGGRALDHQRGQPARLAEHLRRLLRRRPRRARAGRDRRARRGRPARAARPRDRLLLRLPQQRRRPTTQFWEELGAKGGAAFAAAVDHVGLQVYPGLFWPPATTDPAGDVIEALTLLRDCWMPKAGLGRDVALWVTENGYATRGGTGEERQAADLTATLDALARYSGTLGITDYRYFNLRDNRSTGPDLFDAVGLLFDDYREKRGVRGVPGCGRRAWGRGAGRSRGAANGSGACVAGDRSAADRRAGAADAAADPRAQRGAVASTARLYGWGQARADRSARAGPAALPLRRPAGPAARTGDELRPPRYRLDPRPSIEWRRSRA